MPFSGCAMTLQARGDSFSLYDFYGNAVPAENGQIVVPLDARGFYLRGNGQNGSFAALVDAIRHSRIDGLEPLAIVCRDMLAPVEHKPSVRLTLMNMLHRPLHGTLTVKLAGLTVTYPHELDFAPDETKEVNVQITGGNAAPDNRYPLTLRYDAGADGVAVHEETMRVNCIAKRTITVDGRLDDWQGVIPQEIRFSGAQQASLTEKAWLPFQQFDESVKQGFAVAYLAYDATNFYFAAKVADPTPDAGTLRFEKRPDDEFFYPPTAYVMDEAGVTNATDFSVRWTGRLTPPTSGEYKISVRHDGGVRLWLGGQLVIDNWNPQPGQHESVAPPVTWQAGQGLDLKLEYHHQQGKGGVTLVWDAPKLGRAGIYSPCFSTPDGKASRVRGQYYGGTEFQKLVQTRDDPNINFGSWPGQPSDADFGTPRKQALNWPAGVRRYSYRKQPILPNGAAPNFDNIQIAFNVLSADQKMLAPFPPGRCRATRRINARTTSTRSTPWRRPTAAAPRSGGCGGPTCRGNISIPANPPHRLTARRAVASWSFAGKAIPGSSNARCRGQNYRM